MPKLHFETIINAPREHVWKTMLDDATYREWTEPFYPGSYYEGSWEQGSDIRFLAPGEDGTTGGMFARIVENRPYEFISIQHLGEVKDGKPDTSATPWEEAFENYTFTDTADGGTKLEVDMDIGEGITDPEYAEMFKDMWPKGLEKLKEIAERKQGRGQPF